MFSITKRVGNRVVALDLHALPVRLADGTETRADKLDRDQMHEVVRSLGIDVKPGAGWQETATALAVYQHEQREKAAA
jgi:hypothetical protein